MQNEHSPAHEEAVRTVNEIEALSRRLREIVPFYTDKCFFIRPGDGNLAWVAENEVEEQCRALRLVQDKIASEMRFMDTLDSIWRNLGSKNSGSN